MDYVCIGPCTMFGLCLLIDEAYVWTMLDVECVGLCWMLNVLDLMYVRMLNECVCRCGHVLCECVERRHVSCFQLLREGLHRNSQGRRGVIIPILHVTINLCWIHGDMLGESGS